MLGAGGEPTQPIIGRAHGASAACFGNYHPRWMAEGTCRFMTPATSPLERRTHAVDGLLGTGDQCAGDCSHAGDTFGRRLSEK